LSASTRSPVLGYNHNIRHRGIVFHVQTEDSGVENPHIYTHIFQGGVILASRKLDYDGEAAAETVKALMQAQHKAVLKDLKRGAFNEKIEAYFGDKIDDAAPSGEAEAVSAPAPATQADRSPRAMTEIDPHPPDHPPLATARDDSQRSTGVPQVAAEAEDDATERMEKVGDDVAAAFDAVQNESTSPAAEVKVTWRAVSPPPSTPAARPTMPPPIPDAAAAQARRVRRTSENAPRIPHPDDRPGAYRHRSPSRDVLESSPRDEAPAGDASAQGKQTIRGPGNFTPPRRPPDRRGVVPRDPPGAIPSQRSPVVVSRPSVIVGGPGGGQGAAPRAQPAVDASRRRERPDKRKREGLFGQDLISEKSLDEVILAYLSEDSSDE
jgi:hypothetical protein